MAEQMNAFTCRRRRFHQQQNYHERALFLPILVLTTFGCVLIPGGSFFFFAACLPESTRSEHCQISCWWCTQIHRNGNGMWCTPSSQTWKESKKKRRKRYLISLCLAFHTPHTGSVRRGRLSGGMVEKCSEKLSSVRSIINSLQAKPAQGLPNQSEISRHRENTEWEKIKTETYVDYAFGM